VIREPRANSSAGHAVAPRFFSLRTNFFLPLNNVADWRRAMSLRSPWSRRHSASISIARARMKRREDISNDRNATAFGSKPDDLQRSRKI
jgi:hypothetical protein